MFGGKKLQEANAQLDALRRELDREKSARAEAEKQLSNVRSKVSELEAKLKDTDLEQLKEKAKESIAEYEGLKDLYSRKISDFDNSKEEQEQAFAREAALQRHSLENEIRDNRQANQDFVASTVKTFSESYNYYLNQIKTLMDALGNVAARTGSALFEAGNGDLKEHFGLQMVEELKSGLDGMQNEAGDRILIGAAEEAPAAAEEVAECCEEAAECCSEEAEKAAECCCEEVKEAAEEAAECCGEAAEATECCCEEVKEAAGEAAEEITEAAEEITEG